MIYYADGNKVQKLGEHIKGVKENSERFSGAFGCAGWGALLGDWHDLGKFAESIDPIVGKEVPMSRTAAVSVDDPDDKGLGARKSIVPYGLYRIHGYISAPLAERTGFSEADLDILWSALQNMFDHDPAAARTGMHPQKLIVFKHASELGNAPAQKLFNLVKVEKNCGEKPPRSFADYDVSVGEAPAGVELIEML